MKLEGIKAFLVEKVVMVFFALCGSLVWSAFFHFILSMSKNGQLTVGIVMFILFLVIFTSTKGLNRSRNIA